MNYNLKVMIKNRIAANAAMHGIEQKYNTGAFHKSMAAERVS